MGSYIGIDVSKDRLYVHILPQDEAFSVDRNGSGLAVLVDRVKPLAPSLVAIEATGGFETTTAAALAAAGLPLAIINPAQIRHYAQALVNEQKRMPSMQKSLLVSLPMCVRKRDRFPMNSLSFLRIWWPGAGRSSR
jgi:hypothetical protein